MATINKLNFGTGTTGQVLTSNGSGIAPTFQTLNAKLFLIQSQTASSSASLSFINLAAAGVSTIMCVISDLVPASQQELYVLASTNNGGSYDNTAGNYQSGGQYIEYNSTTFSNFSSNQAAPLSSSVDSAEPGANGVIFFYNINTSINMTFTGNMSYLQGSHIFSNQCGGYYSFATGVNALQFHFTSATNLNSGKITLFGVRES